MVFALLCSQVLRSSHDRGNFLLTKHAKVVAMTCTHAAIKRRDFAALGFQYDTLVMEEAAQVRRARGRSAHGPPCSLGSPSISSALSLTTTFASPRVRR